MLRLRLPEACSCIVEIVASIILNLEIGVIAMVDSRLKSLSEALTNIAPGWTINFIANLFLLPLFAADYASGDVNRIAGASFIVGCVFTVISVVRSYYLRRLFERFGEKVTLATLIGDGIARIRGRFAK
jgi:hypothetical protein